MATIKIDDSIPAYLQAWLLGNLQGAAHRCKLSMSVGGDDGGPTFGECIDNPAGRTFYIDDDAKNPPEAEG